MSKSVNQMSKAERIAFYNSPEGKALDKKTHQKWKSLVNMSASELESFYNTKDGKEAGLSQSEANKQGISSGRESARWILKMKKVPYTQWTENMWRWAKKQISFISRMSGNKGDLYDEKGNKTRKHTSLLIWGHNPEKKFANENFKRWFANSKAVDKKSNPLIVYHGSPDLRGLKSDYIFKTPKEKFGSEDDYRAYFFTDSRSIAKSYADPMRAFDYQGAEEGVMSFYLSLQNPLILDAGGEVWRKFETTIYGVLVKGTRNIVNHAQREGFDGVIIKNVKDYYDNNYRKNSGGNVYVAFKPTQIKLADGTNTTFDANNPDIRFSGGGTTKRTISQTPAPKKDRIYGSKINKPNSAESKSKASSIILSPNVIKSIGTIIKEHNEDYPNKKVPLSSAKAVVRRGMGAYSSTHRPTISGGKPNSRVAWGLARLNAFIYKIQKGYSKSGKYIQDDDLMNELGFTVKNYSNGGTSISFEYTIGGL